MWWHQTVVLKFWGSNVAFPTVYTAECNLRVIASWDGIWP
jgi:hypothetical protein